MKNRAFVVAHYHPQGAIPAHLRNLVAYCAALPAHVVFVSTSLADGQAATLPSAVEVITRPNVGYDFHSYKTGIDALGDLSALDELVLLNDSFVCLDPARLCGNFFARSSPGVDLLGLTASHEIAPHLQSYFIAFDGRRVLDSAAFREWWAAMEPQSERSLVIPKHEVGLSRHFHERGFTLAAAFSPSAQQKQEALRRWAAFRPEPRAAETLNPTHFLWDFLADEFAIVKKELLAKNPYGLDLGRLEALRRGDPRARALIDDAMEKA